MREFVNFLILGAGEAQQPAIVRAKKMGLRVIAIDPSPDASGFKWADEQHCRDLADIEFCLSVAKQAAVSGVMTMSAEYPVPTVAAICQALDLPGLTTVAARNATNKKHMRDAFLSHGVPSPTSFRVDTFNQAQAARSRIGGCCIVKPTLSHGGRGITQVDVHESAENLKTAVERALSLTRGDGILIEQFVEGPEFSVETITSRGNTTVIATTEKLTTGAPYFAEVGHNQPTALSQVDLNRVVQTAIDGVDALGIDDSPGHVELRLAKDGPVIMEIGARLGGGFICSDLVQLSKGVDLVSATVDLALGRQPDLTPTCDRGAAIRFLQPRMGRVARISGVDQARSLDGCHRVSVECQVGDTINELRDATARVGYVIFSAECRTEAASRAEQAKSLIQVETV